MENLEKVSPLVSIVVPMRNEINDIDKSIDSFLHQDYPSDCYEVIIADGDSDDGSSEKIQEYVNSNPNLKVVRNRKRVRAAGVNIGIKLAEGEIIVIMDFHVVYPPSYVTECVKLLNAGMGDNVGGVIETRPGSNTLIARCIALILKHRFGVGGSRFRICNKSGFVDTVPFGAFKKSLIDKIGLFDERLVRTEDNEFNSRIIKYGGRIFMSSSIRSIYYSRSTISGLCKQAYGSGKSHISTLLVGAYAFQLRHFIPLVFFLSIIVGVLGWIWAPLFILMGISLGAYTVGSLIATFDIVKKDRIECVAVLPWLFFLYHFTYGFGTLMGILGLTKSIFESRILFKLKPQTSR